MVVPTNVHNPYAALVDVRDILHQTDFRTSLRNCQIAIRDWPWDSDHIYPNEITVHPSDDRFGEGTRDSFDVGYGVGVTLVLSTGGAPSENVEAISEFRHEVFKRFTHFVPALPMAFLTTVEPGRWQLPRQRRMHYNVSQIVVRYWFEEDHYEG